MKSALLLIALAPAWTALPHPAQASDSPPPAYAPLTFDVLSEFPFDVTYDTFGEKPDPKRVRPKIRAMIPKSVLALDGKNVKITGFMLPLDDDAGGMKKFILMRNQITCCFGGANRINEYIMVTMNGAKTAPFVPNVPVAIEGTLTVGPQFEDGVLNGIYQMSGDEVVP